jgi:hypothetical protein
MAKPTQPKPGRPARPSGRPAQPLSARPAGTQPLSAKSAPASPVTAGPSQDGVGLFQDAMQALQRHQFTVAADRFRALLAGFPGERALLDRARVYLELCEREVRRQPQAPVTAEEKLTAATAALNDGRDGEAEHFAHAVLEEQPDHDLALYLLAAVHARRGDSDAALDWLGRAIGVSPDVRAQAVHDVDFESLREHSAFQQLLDTAAFAQSGTRRHRKGRSER